jgi:hypothetical protein
MMSRPILESALEMGYVAGKRGKEPKNDGVRRWIVRSMHEGNQAGLAIRRPGPFVPYFPVPD